MAAAAKAGGDHPLTAARPPPNLQVHDAYQDRVGVEISSGIKPKVELLFSIALAMAEDICVKDVRITT